MSLEGIVLSAISQAQKGKYCIVPLYSGMVVAKGWEREGMGNCLMGIEFHFCKMKSILEIGCIVM